MFISFDSVSKDFRKKPAALDEVTLDLPTGLIGLLGANGAGKTTLMRILCGIIQPSRGRVTVDGYDLAAHSARRALKMTLGYLPQDIEPYPQLTPREFLDYIGVLKGVASAATRRSQADELIARVGLADARDRRIGGFSGGMRRRVGIAQALMGDPRLLVVDEPTAGLDPEERMRFRTLLAGLGEQRTVLLSTHILDDVAQTCPYVCVLRAGRVAFAGPTSGLVDGALGRTWLTAPGRLPPPGATVVNAMMTAAGPRYRVVTAAPPADAEAADPTLEDGYMMLITQEDSP
ncbi:ABC transporter ATP-binding protein [Leucobacter sp. BZR 635]